jgi:hypothetical protein
MRFPQNIFHKVLYMLLPIYVLSNTGLDDKMEQIQVFINKRKYKNAEYDDNVIEYLMKYLELEITNSYKTF